MFTYSISQIPKLAYLTETKPVDRGSFAPLPTQTTTKDKGTKKLALEWMEQLDNFHQHPDPRDANSRT